MLSKISKKFINQHIIPNLDLSHFGRPLKAALWRYIKAIIYRLKTGCQWRELPVRSFFGNILISWNTIYYHFNKWCKLNSWKRLWIKILRQNKNMLDLSNTSLDGSHTPVFNGGEEVGYQGQKRRKTTNLLFLTDNNGIPISMSKSISGEHNDLFMIKKHFKNMLNDLKKSTVETEGLFLNADAGFDGKSFRLFCQKNEIIANINFNKRNSKTPDSEFVFDNLLLSYTVEICTISLY